MKNIPESEWLMQGLGGAVLVLAVCAVVSIVLLIVGGRMSWMEVVIGCFVAWVLWKAATV